MRHAEHYPALLDFLRGIGLEVVETTLPDDTFLPGLELRDGGIRVDPARLPWAGDLLHEAGHLAVLPEAQRRFVGVFDEDSLQAEHAGEQEAMAWAWAAACHLRLPPEVLIHDGGYHGRGADVLMMYQVGVIPGLRGLCEIGMTTAVGFGAEMSDSVSHYPTMRRWLRE